MNQYEILDEALAYINSNESNTFNFLMESINIELLSEKVDIKAIGKKIMQLIDALIKKAKDLMMKIKEKILKLKNKDVQDKLKMKAMEDSPAEKTNVRIFNYSENIYEYDGQKYNESQFGQLLKQFIDNINDFRTFINCPSYTDIDEARRVFEKCKNRSDINKFTASNIKITKEKHTGISESEYDKFASNRQEFIKNIMDESIDVSRCLDKLKKTANDVEKIMDDTQQERYQMVAYMISKFEKYDAILNKLFENTSLIF